MRGDDLQQQAMFSYISPEARVPKDHPSLFQSEDESEVSV